MRLRTGITVVSITAAGLALGLVALNGDAASGQDDPSRGWPRWQRLAWTPLSDGWRVQVAGASVAWRFRAKLVEVGDPVLGPAEADRSGPSLSAPAGDDAAPPGGGGEEADDRAPVPVPVPHADAPRGPEATELGLEAEGRPVRLRLPRLPSSGAYPLGLRPGQEVEVELRVRQGFEGEAAGLSLRGPGGELLLVYDDGGYGPAFTDAAACGGVEVRRKPAPDTPRGWVTDQVAFALQGAEALASERRPTPLGRTGLVALLVVARRWTGPPVTDADLAPLAWVVYRAGGE